MQIPYTWYLFDTRYLSCLVIVYFCECVFLWMCVFVIVWLRDCVFLKLWVFVIVCFCECLFLWLCVFANVCFCDCVFCECVFLGFCVFVNVCFVNVCFTDCVFWWLYVFLRLCVFVIVCFLWLCGFAIVYICTCLFLWCIILWVCVWLMLSLCSERNISWSDSLISEILDVFLNQIFEFSRNARNCIALWRFLWRVWCTWVHLMAHYFLNFKIFNPKIPWKMVNMEQLTALSTVIGDREWTRELESVHLSMST